MPIYVHVCESGHTFDVFLKMKDYNQPQVCKCGAASKRKIVPTMINCDIQSWDYYESPVSGKPITSYKARREDMARNNCVDYDPGMKDAQKKRINRLDADLDKKVEDTVDREWDKMPSAKRENLANELLLGADVEIKRI